jgi:hypothetical protein
MKEDTSHFTFGEGMKEALNFERCVSVLTGEIDLLKKISALQGKVRQSVISRDWTDFDVKIQDLNLLGTEFAVLENERERLFPGDEGKPFYAAVAVLPVEESRELSRLYRELKMETLKMRALNETFLAYLNEAKALASAYIETVCPARGGKLYTRKGRKASQDLKSIVFNNRF